METPQSANALTHPAEEAAKAAETHTDSTLSANESTTATAGTPAESNVVDTITAQPSDVIATTDETQEPINKEGGEELTKEELLARLQAIAEAETDVDTETVAHIKQQFYSLHNEATRAAKAQFTADGNDPETFVPEIDATEQLFKEALAAVRDKKAEQRARVEAEQNSNYETKKAIINEIATLSEDTDNVNKHYQRVKELQTQFRETGEVPPQHNTALWKEYQDTVERFYDRWKVNKELRDYDFKKNLGEKQLLLDEAKALANEPDVITAFRRLQELHDKWRDIGPVAKDIREEIWASFKDASAEVNKRYQTFFEDRKKKERDNEDAKNAICKRIEALDFAAPTNFAAWDEMTRTIIAAQEEWKTIGFASRKANNALFARFRALCDDFFTRKATFFKSAKEEMAANLKAKTAIAEQAEQLADSTDWKATAEKLQELQKQWKQIGAVPRKHSDEVWKRFTTACDSFFDRRKKNSSGTRKAENANFKAKKEIVATLKRLNSPDDNTPREDAIKQLHELRAQWQATGHVPFKDKDKLHEEYRTVVGELFDKLDVHENRARLASFEADVEDMGDDRSRLIKEKERLVRAYDARKSELNTYENNLGFFNSKSKSGESMLKDLQKKIQRLRDDISQIAGKIEIINSKL